MTAKPNYLEAVCEPFPGLSWMATGRISVETIPDRVGTGVSGFGVGGKPISGGVSDISKRLPELKVAGYRAFFQVTSRYCPSHVIPQVTRR